MKSSAREVVEKTLHDAIFDIACSYIALQESNTEKDDAGDYIKLKKVFSFIDFNYLEKIFAENSGKSFLNKLGSVDDKKIKDITTVLKLFKCLVPYSRMLVSFDGYLIPLDDRYFRINPYNLGFKYGGEITCVGLITNIIGESSDPGEDGDMFTKVQFQVNEALRQILPSKSKDLCIVHPIALYYGE